jgi:hypothetical protein
MSKIIKSKPTMQPIAFTLDPIGALERIRLTHPNEPRARMAHRAAVPFDG